MSSIFKNCTIKQIDIVCADGHRTYTDSSKYDKQVSVLELFALGNRYYELVHCTKISVDLQLACGSNVSLKYVFQKGFITNFRSGGLIVDRFIDQIGSELDQLCWLLHDADYTPCANMYNGNANRHPLCKKDSDELLYAMLLWSGVHALKAKVIWQSVNLFGGSAYKDDDDLTISNSCLFAFFRGLAGVQADAASIEANHVYFKYSSVEDAL